MWWRKTATAQPTNLPARSALAMALEPRMLFDGAVAATVAETATAVPSADAAHDPAAGQDAHSGSENLAATPTGTTDNRQEVVFVDSSVKDYQQLVSALKPGTEVVVLDDGQDGLRQIADYLDGRRDIDAIHVFSHGDAGKVQLGNVWIDDAYVAANNALLADIGSALSSSGDILLYGCHVGADGSGVNFIQSLAAATGADIAASTDPTGAADKGGDWVLEATRGSVETVSLNIGSYSGLLAAFSDNFTTNPGTTSNSFDRTLGGVSYTYTFTADGDGGAAGGGLAFDNFGSGGSAAMTLLSSAFNTSTTERVTITRTDLADFTFTSIYIDNPGGNESVTVGGYLNGVLVGSAQVFTTGTTTLNFGGIRVDEVRLTSTDFFGLAIDDFTGDTNPPNSAPIINNLNGNSATFVEGGSPVLLDENADATVTDSDSANFDTGNVTVAIIGNGVGAEDVLSIRNQGTGAGQIGVSGSAITYGGTQIGTYVGGTAGSSLVITLDSDATPAAVQALVRNLTYSNSNNSDPSSAARTVRITVSDGDGGTSSNADVTVNVTGVNDAPTLTATGGTPTYTENGSAVDLFSGVGISTVESGQTITGMTLSVSNLADGSSEILRIDGTDIALTNGTSGTTADNGIGYSVSLTGGTASITLTKVGGVSTAIAQTVVDGMSYRNGSDAPNTATRVVTLTGISDNGGTANGGVDSSVVAIAASVSVSAVNDAPVVTTTGGSSAFSEGGSSVAIDAGLTLSDVDSSTLASATVSITGGFQSGADVLAFTNDGSSSMGNITASYDAGTGVLTLSSAGASATLAQWQAALRSVSYSNSSDAPSTTDRTISFTANDGQDGSTAATKIVSVTATNDAPQVTAPATIGVTEDVPSAISGISFSDVDAGSGSVTVTLSVASGSLAASSGGGVAVGGTASAMTLTGSIANINTFIAGSNVSFTTAANATADVTLTASIDDGGNSGSGGAQQDSETVTLQVTAVNDAPSITAPGSIAITEDVATALSGISFSDVDAGTSPVTVTLSVASGGLGATSASGVTVGGTASSMTLTGSLSDINAFIALGGVVFTTASNATSDVTLTIEIDDGGNTGSGGAQTDSTTVTLDVSAVNDAPVNSLPSAQNVDQDANLVFNSGNGNLISISDVDAGSNMVEVTLSATNGLLSLSDITGLSFSTGDGTGDASMTFSGSISDINNALNGLVFTPTGGYNGAASIQISTNDQGWSGSGGAQTDTDTVSITVNSLNPRITDVSAGTADGIYKVGDTITITATFSEAVTVDTTGGIPTLLLETGSVDRLATYLSGSGGNTLTFSYVVQAGDLSVDLDYQSTAALNLNGSTIRGATANDAILTLAAPGAAGSLGANKALVVDGVRPAATNITLSDTALSIGETATVTITFAERVVGLDTADFTVAGGTLTGLSSADGGLTWTATFTPDSNLSDATNVITLDNTGVMDLAGNIGSGTTDSVNYAIDTQRPTASIVVTDTALRAGQSTTVTITFSEAVVGLTMADFSVANGTLSNLSTSDNITWTATLTPSSNVTDTTNLVTLDNTGVQDTAGNAGVGTTDSNNYAIDTQRPTAGIVITDTALKAGQSTTVTITFSEAVTGLTTADFSVANGTLGNLSSSDGGITWTATLTPDADVTDATNLITLNNTGYTDAAGNTGTGTTDSNNYAIDSKAPAITSVGVPANGTYVAGDALDFTVNFDEAVTVDTAGGTPRLAITLDTGGTVYANYLSGSGSTALVFRLTIANGQQDSNGIAIGTNLQSNGATLRDAAGNDTATTLNNVGATSAVLVDAAPPQVTGIALDDTSPTTNSTLGFTVTFSEDVNGVDLTDFALATTGSASGTLLSLVQIDARTYRITVGGVTGQGTLGLSLTAAGSGIVDAVGNTLQSNFSSAGYTLGGLNTGDPEFRANPTPNVPTTPTAPPQPNVPGAPPSSTTSPLLPPPLFEQPTLGSGVPTVGNIFINNGALAPSFIAQVFASSDSGAGNGSGIGFLGFGGGDGGVFGTSSFSSMFNKDVPLESGEIQLRWGTSSGNGLGGGEILGAPTLSQQLQEIGESEQRQIRELAWALGEIPLQMPQA
ncbi:MAG: Ig-like domain-containing protein [Pseudomonadaceae bacterium]